MYNSKNILEEHISTLLKQGKKESIPLIYQHYSDDLYGLIFKIVPTQEIAQQTLQECFIRIWKEAKHYEASKESLYSWLACIARKTAIEKTATTLSKIQTNQGNIEASIKPQYLDSPLLKKNILVQKAINSLDEQHKTLIELAYFKGYSSNDIQQKLNIPLNTVQSKMKSAILQLRNKLEQY